MRLTLRTLLAYLDNVLEPADAEQLGAKIRESEFATGLVQRIQSILHRPRIGAPKLNSRGLALDANHMAEYLDSSLPPERVGDFERVCLESDMSLAEAAACHQILTLVLAKPADVPAGLRERIYSLDIGPSVAVASAVAATAAPAGIVHPPHEPVAATPPPPPPKTAEVPDYLRAGRRSRVLPFVATLAGAFLIAALGLRAMGPFDQTHPIMRWLGMGPAPVVADADQSPDQSPDTTPPQDNTDVVPNADTAPDAAAPSNTESVTTPSTKSGKTSADSAAATDSAKSSTVPEADTPANPLDKPTTDVPSPLPREREPGLIPPPPPVEPQPLPMDRGKIKPVPAPDALASNTPSDTVPPATPDTTPPASPMPATPAEPMPSAAADVGRFVSDEHVLGRYDPAKRIWVRMPPRALLVAGEQLISLPTYRPQLALASGAQLTMFGEASLRLDRPRENASAVTVEFGRLAIETLGAAGVQVVLNLNGVKGTAVLSDADSSLAIDVHTFRPPGVDPENVDAPPIAVVELQAVRGRVVWQGEGEKPLEIAAGFIQTYADGKAFGLEGPIRNPEWVEARTLVGLDRETSIGLEAMLEANRPLNISLQEVLQDRRVDFRALAARCLGVINVFEPLIKELSDERQKSFWASEIDSLHSALARGPETAAAVRETIERLRPMDARAVYRLLWGYSPEQLARGEADQLVKYLESPELDVRVLAFDNLRRITGVMLLYRPERKADQNRGPITKWKEKLKVGEIAYKVLPSPFSERRPAEKPASDRAAPDRPVVRPATPIPGPAPSEPEPPPQE